MKKINRVRKSQEFQQIISNGKKTVNRSFVYYYQPKKNDQARIGISLSKKMGHAVDRNLYKRQVRMMCQEIIDFNNYPFDGILILRLNYRELTYADNKKHLENALHNGIM